MTDMMTIVVKTRSNISDPLSVLLHHNPARCVLQCVVFSISTKVIGKARHVELMLVVRTLIHQARLIDECQTS